ncbi:hypothetical protein BXY85_2336 [Roseivirga pacifica]|uniref:Uncharacterized protein n=1 Tax=Roseivirga pacifica TaxID=1267423 RepID=A0A1I0NMT0_9BACT|nr:hypothetical protein [Roseivirga pacifica]RKQ51313.1 hypothetical protein BXY85_2336 [Roseivirga pacifica]SEW02579.1 hypothetical protein SAMN05216290_1318 [Roseivirga pacifica]
MIEWITSFNLNHNHMRKYGLLIFLIGICTNAWAQDFLGLNQTDIESKLIAKSIDYEAGVKNGIPFISYIKNDDLAFAYQFDSNTKKAIVCMVFIESAKHLKEVEAYYNKHYTASTEFTDSWSHRFNGAYSTAKLSRNQGGPGKAFIHWSVINIK